MNIVAVSTPPGQGAIAIIRLSGPDAFSICQRIWKGKPIDRCDSHTAHLGTITDADGNDLDQALITLFQAPHSFTGENIVEIAVHGSTWIQQAAIEALCNAGARPAEPGEFSKRAFINHKIDLAQAEGIADLISSKSKAAHDLALSQASGAFSRHIDDLRSQLVDLAALLELELDFSEEDITFADRSRLFDLTDRILSHINRLIDSFRAGKAFKKGIPVAIIGIPNAGKSSLLNTLLHDDKAIVTDIPGTTRDTIEDTIEIDGILFRFIDTAGIRHTTDKIEQLGIQRTHQAIQRAQIILRLHPADSDTPTEPIELQPHQTLIDITTKQDLIEAPTPDPNRLQISTLTGHNIDRLRTVLAQTATRQYRPDTDIIITNARHLHNLRRAQESLMRVSQGIADEIPTDMTAQDLREGIRHLAELTGAIPPTLLLTTIFSRFCIGK